MNPWVSLVVLLAGVNLTRLLGRGVTLAILTVVILAAAVALDPDPTAAWVPIDQDPPGQAAGRAEVNRD